MRAGFMMPIKPEFAKRGKSARARQVGMLNQYAEFKEAEAQIESETIETGQDRDKRKSKDK